MTHEELQVLLQETPFKEVGMIGQEIVKISPEYEDCRRAAREHNVPLQAVFDAARREASKLL